MDDVSKGPLRGSVRAPWARSGSLDRLEPYWKGWSALCPFAPPLSLNRGRWSCFERSGGTQGGPKGGWPKGREIQKGGPAPCATGAQAYYV